MVKSKASIMILQAPLISTCHSQQKGRGHSLHTPLLDHIPDSIYYVWLTGIRKRYKRGEKQLLTLGL